MMNNYKMNNYKLPGPTGVAWAGGSLSHACSRRCDEKLGGWGGGFSALGSRPDPLNVDGRPPVMAFGGSVKEVGSSGAASPESSLFRTKGSRRLIGSWDFLSERPRRS